jgi:hypothetical protein
MTMEWVEGERLRTVADNIVAGRDGSKSSATTNSPSRGGSDFDLALVEVRAHVRSVVLHYQASTCICL